MQLALAVLAYIFTAPAQDPYPEQVNAHKSPEQTTSEAQAPSPPQVIWDLAATLDTPLLQALFPPQFTAHEVPAQLIEPAHDPESMHATSQPAALLQSTPPAHPSCPQVIWHEMRDGQVTTDPQAPTALQSMAHVPSA